MEKGTISVCFVAEAMHEAQRIGVDTAALLRQSSLSPELLQMPRARVAPEQYGALWHALAAALGDEFFGMDSHPMRPGSFSMLCHALLTCADLRQALGRTLRFFSLVLDDVAGDLILSQERAMLSLTDRGRQGRLFAHGTLFVIIYGLACWLTGRRLPILEVRFCQEAPEHEAEYRLIFGDSLCFGQPSSSLVFDAASLALPVIRNRNAVREFLLQSPANFLVKYRNQTGTFAKVRARLTRMPPAEWPLFEALAAALHTTPSTLRRRLEEEGSSYQLIKNDLRRDLAIDFLCNSKLPVEDIAHEVGFAEHSAFYRAFRKWTGVSPLQYRLMHG